MVSTAQYLPLAAGIMLSPMPIIASLVLTATGRAAKGGTMFVLGWVLSILGFMIFAVIFLQDLRAQDPESISLFAIIFQFLFALVFMWVAWSNWASRPRNVINFPPPHWIESFSKYSNARLFWMGMVMNFINVKNLPIMITAGLAISKSAEGVGVGLWNATIFALVSSIGVILPWLGGVFGSERTKPVIERVRNWLYHYNNIIMAVLFFYMGIMLLATALTNLSIYLENNAG